MDRHGPRLPDGQALFVIDRGHDFPSAIQTTLDSFNNKRSFCFRDDKSRKTTLALNVYSSNQGEIRGFEYLTPRKRLNPRDLMDARKVTLPPKYLHCVCAAGRATEIIEEIKELGWMQDTRLCFEPIPDLCAPSELVSLTKVLPDVDIFSPNHTEAAAFFGGEPLVDPQRGVVEQLARKYLDLGAKNKIIIRCGALGACGLSRSNPDCCIWVPAFHQDQVNVKDPTGGGNSFLVSQHER